MLIEKRIKFVCKFIIQVGLVASALFFLSGCGKSLFVSPDFFSERKDKPDEIMVKETTSEKLPSTQLLAEEMPMESEKLGNFGARQGFASFESEMPPVKDQEPPINYQDNTVSSIDEADSRAVSTETSETTVSAISYQEKNQESSLRIIHFRYDESVLTSEALKILAKNVEFLKKNINLGLEIKGHCDSSGSRDYNLALGQARANTVKDFLEKNGIETSRLKAVSYGKDHLLCHEEFENCQKQNRRVELEKTN